MGYIIAIIVFPVVIAAIATAMMVLAQEGQMPATLGYNYQNQLQNQSADFGQKITPLQTTLAQMRAAQLAQQVAHQAALVRASVGLYYPADGPENDPDMPDTMGWRGWNFDGQFLVSPSQRTQWFEPELRVPHWDESDVVRGVAGIHARRVPKNWVTEDTKKTEIGYVQIHGIVERFGRFVLGTEGWRAEWVIVRELATNDRQTAEQLKRSYPDVVIHWVRMSSEVI